MKRPVDTLNRLIVLRNLVRVYSYMFETVLCLMGLLFCSFGFASRNVDVHLPWLPFAPENQLKWVLALSLIGLFCVALARLATVARVIFFMFTVAVVWILFKGLFISMTATFAGAAEARRAAYLVLAAAIAALGAIPLGGRSKKKSPASGTLRRGAYRR